MEDKSIEIFEGELGVQLKEEPPPKPVRLRRADGQSSKKKKEGPSSSRQLTRKPSKEKPRATPSQNSSDDENPWEGITLNRCLIVAVIIILVSTGVNSMNDALQEYWEMEDGEGSTEEADLRHDDLTQGSILEEAQDYLWDTLFWWRRGPQEDDEDLRGFRSKKKLARKRKINLDSEMDGNGEEPEKQLSEEEEEDKEDTGGGKRVKEKNGDGEEEGEIPRRKRRERDEARKREQRQG